MKKQFLAGAIAALAVFNASALTAGDVAFTSFNADEDGMSLVTLVDLAANSKIYFTDNEWTGTAFNTGESYSSWSSGAAVVNAGTVIRFNNIDSATLLGASVGTYQREAVSGSTNYGLSQSADTIYAYTGATATAPTSFLAVVSSGTLGTAGDGLLTNTGLSIGAGAIQLSNSSDFAQYNGARAGEVSFAGYKTMVSALTNWQVQGDGSFAATVPNTTAFSITPVPEPESYAMLLAGLGLIGTIARRRQRQSS
jgi:hypothetical protein